MPALLSVALILMLAAQGAASAAATPGAVPPRAARPARSHASPAQDDGPARKLIERGVREARTDPEASKRDAERALALLTRSPDRDLTVRARLLLCDYQSERDVSAAQRQVSAATALLAHLKRPGLTAGVMLCEGTILETAGQSVKALEQYRRALALAASAHDDEMLAQGRFQLGHLLGVLGDYANALAQLRQAERLFEKLGQRLDQLAAQNSIAILYNRIGDYGEARHIYSRVLESQTAQQRDRALTLSNLGQADEYLHDWAAARQAYTQCLAISTQIGYLRAQAYALRGLAAVANATGDGLGALATLERAAALQRQTPDARLHAAIQLERGIALHKLGRLTEASAALEDAARVFREADARGELATTDSELASVYAAAGNWRAAYADQTRAKSLSDQLLKNQIDERFAALKVEFDTAAKEQENTALLAENQANATALAESRSARHLQLIVIFLMVLLGLLGTVLTLLQLRATRRLRVLAMTDELTGVPNRRAVLTRLDTLLTSSEKATSILIIDVDHFKSINDGHGHPAGDEILKRMAARIQAAVTPPAFFGRLGGEEFLAVLPATELVAAARVAEGLLLHIAATDIARLLPGRRLTASIGVAAAAPRTATVSTLLSHADKALYAAKHGGRNCVRTEPASAASGAPPADGSPPAGPARNADSAAADAPAASPDLPVAPLLIRQSSLS